MKNLNLFYLCTDCVYKGQYYTRGDIFDKGDYCNTCKCMADGTIQCSEKQCFPGNPCKKFNMNIDIFEKLGEVNNEHKVVFHIIYHYNLVPSSLLWKRKKKTAWNI